MKSNVCYNLFKSPYHTQYKNYTFYFSSQFNKDRFDIKIKPYIETETFKLNSKYHAEIHSEIVLALNLYRQIEKRGFYVLSASNLPISKYYSVEMVVV